MLLLSIAWSFAWGIRSRTIHSCLCFSVLRGNMLGTLKLLLFCEGIPGKLLHASHCWLCFVAVCLWICLELLRGKMLLFNWLLALIWLFASHWFKCRSIFSVLKSQTLNTRFLALFWFSLFWVCFALFPFVS